MNKRIASIVLAAIGAPLLAGAVLISAYETSVEQPPGGAGSTEYILCDFDTAGSCVNSSGEVHDADNAGSGSWTDDYNDGDVVMTVWSGGTTFGSTDCELSVATGAGIGGTDALKMTATQDTDDICVLWVGAYEITAGGGIANTKTCETYLVGCDYETADVNRLEINFKFPSGFRDTYSQNLPPDYPYHQSVHFGNYCHDPAKLGTVDTKETDNQHYYHQTWVNHDEAGTAWIKMVFNMQPTHQRSYSGKPNTNNPCIGGDYYNVMTRFYFDWCLENCDPEISHPYDIIIDDIRLYKVNETIPVSVDLLTVSKGDLVDTNPKTLTARFINGTAGEVCGEVALSGYYANVSTLEDGGSNDKTGAQCFSVGTTDYTFEVNANNAATATAGVTFVPDTEPNSDASHTNVSGVNGDGGGYDERRWWDAVPNGGYGPNDAPGLSGEYIRTTNTLPAP